MFTLRLIFYGLVALVPSINGEGAMVLFPSARPGPFDSPNPCIPVHSTSIFTVKETNGRLYLEPLVELMGKKDEKGVRYIELDGLFVEGINLARTRPTGSSGEFSLPSKAVELEDYTWIPQIDRISAPSRDVRMECLVTPDQCEVDLVFRTWQGNLRTCHLAHSVTYDQKCVEKKGPIAAYRFRALGSVQSGGDVIQAVADAFILETRVSSDNLRFYVEPKVGGEEYFKIPHGPSRTVTLLFANLPLDAGHQKHPDCSEKIDRHFETYYRLGLFEPQLLLSRPLPHYTDDLAALDLTNALECEPEITALTETAQWLVGKDEDGRACSDVKPHSIEVCANAAYLPTNLPSTRSNPRTITASGIQKATVAVAADAQPGTPAPNRLRPPAQRPPGP